MNGNEYLNQFIQILLPILATVLTAVFTYIGNRLKKVFEEKINNETAKTVVQDAVKFVEQVYTDLSGKEKLEKATEQVSEILKSKGIVLSSAEINMLIESAVYGLNEGWFDKKENQEILKKLQTLALNMNVEENSKDITEDDEINLIEDAVKSKKEDDIQVYNPEK